MRFENVSSDAGSEQAANGMHRQAVGAGESAVLGPRAASRFRGSPMTLLMTPPTPSANGNGHAGHAVSFWENWFQHATPSQRQEALSLAVQQGLLVQHQLPKVANGVAPKPAAPKPEAAAATAGLAAFLAGLATRTEPLDVLVPADNITWHDLELDAVQQHAVRAALSTPDLFLLHGWPGTGKCHTPSWLL